MIFQRGASVTQPVNKKKRADCVRAHEEAWHIAAKVTQHSYVVYTDGSRLLPIDAT